MTLCLSIGTKIYIHKSLLPDICILPSFCKEVNFENSLVGKSKQCFSISSLSSVFQAVPIVSHFKLVPYAVQTGSWFELPQGNQEESSLPILFFSLSCCFSTHFALLFSSLSRFPLVLYLLFSVPLPFSSPLSFYFLLFLLSLLPFSCLAYIYLGYF